MDAAEAAEEFLERVHQHVPQLSRQRFSYKSWRFARRPTSEGVGLMPGIEVDVEAMVGCILDVEGYRTELRYVAEIEKIDEHSATDFTYIQRLRLPALGRMQMALRLVDMGQRHGYRVVAWAQDDQATDALDPKSGGARTEYNLGAWLLRPDEVAYALSSAPRRKDVGTLKYALLTSGAEVTASEMLKQNIEGMLAWSRRA